MQSLEKKYYIQHCRIATIFDIEPVVKYSL